MKSFTALKDKLPDLQSILLVVLSAVILVFSFPDFSLSFLAWFGLVPLFFAIDRTKESFVTSFLCGWIFGTLFFFGTCWWLTYAPITYAGFPAIVAYFLLFIVTAIAGAYIGLFSAIFALFVRRFGYWGILAAPFLWTSLDFLRLWTTGNNWNAIGYSQAFSAAIKYASFGGVFFVGFLVVFSNSFLVFAHYVVKNYCGISLFSFQIPKLIVQSKFREIRNSIRTLRRKALLAGLLLVPIIVLLLLSIIPVNSPLRTQSKVSASVIAVQPNVPMSGLTQTKWVTLRSRQAELAEIANRSPSFRVDSRRQALADALPNEVGERTRFYEELAIESFRKNKKIVILPESPMNFQYDQDSEFRSFIKEFAEKNNVSVLFNSAEPDNRRKNGYFNSAVMVNERGEKIVQYDKIYLLPFGEMVPLPEPLAQFVPTMVGRFSPGEEYDLLPFGDAKAGVMICFESHFPSLSREYVRNGADVLVEMTNDGYLGNTPVLHQHLASAVFRAVETNRPVLRVTNVGVTTYIDQRGEILDDAGVYQEATRVWLVSKSDGKQTIYVRFGDWFALFCIIVSILLLGLIWRGREREKGRFPSTQEYIPGVDK